MFFAEDHINDFFLSIFSLQLDKTDVGRADWLVYHVKSNPMQRLAALQTALRNSDQSQISEINYQAPFNHDWRKSKWRYFEFSMLSSLSYFSFSFSHSFPSSFSFSFCGSSVVLSQSSCFNQLWEWLGRPVFVYRSAMQSGSLIRIDWYWYGVESASMDYPMWMMLV